MVSGFYLRYRQADRNVDIGNTYSSTTYTPLSVGMHAWRSTTLFLNTKHHITESVGAMAELRGVARRGSLSKPLG